jgi:oxygen-dependent protoporphyrinogen oxidase
MENPIDTLIIGGGLTGLTVAHFLQKYQPEAKITILEKSSSPGGAIRSFNQDGYLAEWGAHGFLDNVEASRELLADTGLDKEAQKAPLDEFVRYICLNGKLNLIPQNPKKIIRSNLVSLPAKLRVLADLWIKPRREEQTVAAWAAYRFGSSLLPFVDAVLTGTYAGDLNRLSIDAVFPGIRALELEKGSVIRGLLQKRKSARVKQENAPQKKLPAMVSFPQGMGRLPEVLAANKNLLCSVEVKSIHKNGDVWEVRTTDQSYRANSLVLVIWPRNRKKDLPWGRFSQPICFRVGPRKGICCLKRLSAVEGTPRNWNWPMISWCRKPTMTYGSSSICLIPRFLPRCCGLIMASPSWKLATPGYLPGARGSLKATGGCTSVVSVGKV